MQIYLLSTEYLKNKVLPFSYHAPQFHAAVYGFPPKLTLQKPCKTNTTNIHNPSWWISVFWSEMCV